MFSQSMGHTIGELLVAELEAGGVDAAHAPIHPVYGGSRICVYGLESRAAATRAVQGAVQRVLKAVDAWPVEVAPSPRKSPGGE
jgi:hypothetical protein